MEQFEKETIIRFDKETDFATVYTHEVKMISRMQKEKVRLEQAGGSIVRLDKYEGTPFGEFIVPVSWVKVTPPKRMESRKGKPVGKGKE
jgi:hypothetical protein